MSDIYRIDGAPWNEAEARRRGESFAAPFGAPPLGETLVAPLPAGPMGRPRKLDEVSKSILTRMLSRGFTVTEAAAFVGCNRTTVVREAKRDPVFGAEVKRAKDRAACEPKDVVVGAAKTNWRAAAWLINYIETTRLVEAKALEKRRERKAAETIENTLKSQCNPS
jgi:hypothetical protein